MIAVAVDLGASSVRFAVGRVVSDRLTCEVVRQEPNPIVGSPDDPRWSLGFLERFVRDAVEYAASLGESATVGIDSWGVDHGFLVDPAPDPVAYRHPAHQSELASLEAHQGELYGWTGIQKQPFNTLVQLRARVRGGWSPTSPWLILPDYLIWRLTGDARQEVTQASTTQMLGVDGEWHPGAIALSMWEAPPPSLVSVTGERLATGQDNVTLVRVGSHDSASALFGLGILLETDLYLNLGTWSILGCVLDKPLTSEAARVTNCSNERAVDGRVRFLKNIPGLWVPNRLHEELRIEASVGEWLATADPSYCRIVDVHDPSLYNPSSMVGAVADLLEQRPVQPEQWASVALRSLVLAVRDAVGEISLVTGRVFDRIRVSGGGSRSAALCQALADATQKRVVAGPVEATLYGNLAVQLLAHNLVTNLEEASRLLDESFDLQTYEPAL
jgi:rhamnulokinase